MSEGKTALKRMAVYYLLLAINILPCASVIPDVFPLRNLSAIYLLILSVCLVLYYAHRVPPTGGLSRSVKAFSWMGLLLILLRGVKYGAFSEVGVLARHTWYLYYLPMLLLPLFLFNIALLVAPKKPARVFRLRAAALAVTLVFIALVLTNDLHRLVFRFQPGFLNWDDEYTRGFLFYAVIAWQYALYLAAILLLVVKCRVAGAKKSAWVILIPFAVGAALNVLLLTGKMPKINGTYPVEFPEALIFTAAAVLECCMQLGLIPTNTGYGKLFRHFSISAQITDRNGTPVYSSHTAVPLTAEQFAAPDGARVGEHAVQHKMKIPGGFGFWRDDLTELDRLNEALAEAKEALSQEAEFIRLRGEWQEKQTKIEQRTLVYDTIARRTQRQSQAISRLAEKGRKSADPAVKEECRDRITLFAAYIKRYANLTLLSRQSRVIETGELGLSLSEVLRYLNFCGIPGEFMGDPEGAVPAEAALAVFEAFETLLETDLSALKGVFVNLAGKEKPLLKVTVENLSEPLPENAVRRLLAAGVRSESRREDDVTYLSFTLPRGGESA